MALVEQPKDKVSLTWSSRLLAECVPQEVDPVSSATISPFWRRFDTEPHPKGTVKFRRRRGCRARRGEPAHPERSTAPRRFCRCAGDRQKAMFTTASGTASHDLVR